MNYLTRFNEPKEVVNAFLLEWHEFLHTVIVIRSLVCFDNEGFGPICFLMNIVLIAV